MLSEGKLMKHLETPLFLREPPFHLTPLFLSNFFMTPLFVQISETKNLPLILGGRKYDERDQMS